MEKDKSSETAVECCISANYNLIAGMQWDVSLFTCANYFIFMCETVFID